ncbi:MAG: type II 3-dehydroquinate dehydratase [Bacteroidales bacterium]|nr:type II 3-dehydroquinate dehydratase [Bacteroidales bacterium]MBR7168049.1 type II 3-dehydroquinate dehydratase [Bacteroidales bacterium]
MKILILNGPNLNLLGVRQTEIYGKQDFRSYFDNLKASYHDIDLEYYQSNVEGEIINKLHSVGFEFDGIILNAGGYTHTSVSIRDAIAAITTPVLEIHISNIYAREEFRHTSLISEVCVGTIAGLGLQGYKLAIDFFAKK